MPKVVDRTRRRQEVLAATWQVISRLGVDRATVREIAAELDCSTGTLSHYFRDKNDVLLSALRYSAQQTADRMRAAVGERTGVAALRALLEEALPLDDVRRAEWSVWLAFWARGLTEPGYRDEQHQRYAEWQAAVELALRGAVAAGDLSHDLDPAHEAVRLVAFVDGIGVRSVLDPESFPPARVRELLNLELLRLRPASPGTSGPAELKA